MSVKKKQQGSDTIKKCAVINDLSGFGKCSLTASIPIISVMGSEVHPLPTAVLSNQTGYDSYKSLSLTDYMRDFMAEWKKLNVSFDAILTGFVTDSTQIDIINTFIDEFYGNNTTLIVDPVMADNGHLYGGYTPEMCEQVKKLCYKADIITPNIAELAFIAEEKYSENFDDIDSYAKKLQKNGIKNIVVTGYKEDGLISNLVYNGSEFGKASAKRIGGYYSGTGDILSSVMTGGVMRGMSLFDSVKLATDFISKVISDTSVTNPNDGIHFEKYLGELV